MFMTPTDINEIIHTINKLKGKNSQGPDGISTKLVKMCVNEIASPLTYIINQSLSTGIVPNKMKTAKVIAIHKSGNDKIFNNYRPISLLPTFSKILEKIVCKRLVSFIDSNNLFYKHQYGFRKKRETIHPIIHFLYDIADHNDNTSKDVTMGLFLDLSKAFDTISHNILLKKLKKIWYSGNQL